MFIKIYLREQENASYKLGENIHKIFWQMIARIDEEPVKIILKHKQSHRKTDRRHEQTFHSIVDTYGQLT